MNQITVSDNKIKPYFIEALGCEGLSSMDIARSLNLNHKVVLQITESILKSYVMMSDLF